MATLVLALLAALASCKRAEPAGAVDEQFIEEWASSNRSIEIGSIQINHEEIKDWMPAMSMPYTVKDKSLLEAAEPGDRVEFSLEATSKGQVVTEIKKVGTTEANPKRGPA